MFRQSSPRGAALQGFALALPFVVLNFIVGNRIEPFFSWIRPTPHTSTQEYILLFTAILLIFLGAVVAARPFLQRGADGRRHFHPLNAVLATLLLVAFVSIAAALGTEIYRCDVLQIPNCD